MARDAASGLHPDLGGRQVDLVMKDHDVTDVDLVEMRRLLNRTPGFIHVGSRQQQDDTLTVNRTFRRAPLKAPPPWANAMAPGDGFDHHKADVVTITGMAWARIAEPNQEPHGTPAYFLSPPPEAGAAPGAPGAPAAAAGAAAAVAAAVAAAAAASAAAFISSA
jgi:hypothetical protein